VNRKRPINYDEPAARKETWAEEVDREYGNGDTVDGRQGFAPSNKFAKLESRSGQYVKQGGNAPTVASGRNTQGPRRDVGRSESVYGSVVPRNPQQAEPSRGNAGSAYVKRPRYEQQQEQHRSEGSILKV